MTSPKYTHAKHLGLKPCTAPSWAGPQTASNPQRQLGECTAFPRESSACSRVYVTRVTLQILGSHVLHFMKNRQLKAILGGKITIQPKLHILRDHRGLCCHSRRCHISVAVTQETCLRCQFSLALSQRAQVPHSLLQSLKITGLKINLG